MRIVDINENSNERYKLHENNLKSILDKAGERPIAVITIVGASKLGKSALLSFMLRYLNNPYHNKWIGSLEPEKVIEGFKWNNGMDSETKGIVMWSEPFNVKVVEGNVAVVLVDTQGLYDGSMNEDDDATFVGLSLATSSTLIFNISQDLKDDNIRNLHKYINHALFARKYNNPSEMIDVKPFQQLMFLIRDWEKLNLYQLGEIGGYEYLTYRLLVQQHHGGTAKRICLQNLSKQAEKTRKEIQGQFAEISGFLMPPPGEKAQKFDGHLSAFEPEFLNYLELFVQKLLSPTKITVNKIAGRVVLASELLHYFKEYVYMFNEKSEQDD